MILKNLNSTHMKDLLFSKQGDLKADKYTNVDYSNERFSIS